TRKQTEERIPALDAKSRKELWQTSYYRAAFTSLFGNGPRATPTVAGNRVYTFGVTGVLTCFAADSGKQLWQVDTLNKFEAKNLLFGMSCSPLVVDNRVLVNVGAKGASVVAFDAASGDVLWKSLDDKASYSSPILVKQGNGSQAIFLTGAAIVSLDPETGNALWKFPFVDLLQESSTTPIRTGDLLLASSITIGSVGLTMKTADGKSGVAETWKNPNLNSYFSTPVPVGPDHIYLVTGT